MKMVWSIGKWNDAKMDIDADRRAVTVNGEKLKDGINNIHFLHNGVLTTASVVVADGEFTSSAEELIGAAVESAGYWGYFIEGFERTDNGIEVIIGS